MTEIVQPRAGVYARQSRGKQKSIAEQLASGTQAADEHGWTLAGTYQDGSSASRFAVKGRDDWERVLRDIADGAIDILILWETSRGDRTLTSWSAMLDLCRAQGVFIYVISDDELYDLRKPKHWKALATSGVDSASESDLMSLRVIRGQAGAAADGRPAHGRTPYGYRRTYDPDTGVLQGQEPDPNTAKYVREVFDRLAKGDAVSAIVNDFNRRNVPTGGAAQWYRARLRILAHNRAYIAERVHNDTVSPGNWPALVTPATFYAVQRILNDPKRVTTRPGSAVHLLSYMARTPCNGVMAAAGGRYRCEVDGCVTIDQREVDDLVTRMVLGRLQQPDVYNSLRRQGDDADKAVIGLRDEIATLQARLDGWRLSAVKGETTPASLSRIEAELSGQIKALQRRVDEAEIPPELQWILEPGADIHQRWKDAPMAAKRRTIIHVADIRIGKAPVPGSRIFDFWRLSGSRFAGDHQTWGEIWAEQGV